MDLFNNAADGFMRTEGLRDFLTGITRIHVNYYHTLFLSEQFLADNSSLIERTPDALAGTAFDVNQYSTNFNYRLKTIPTRIQEYRAATLISDFVLTVSVFEWYVMWLYDFVHACGRTGFVPRLTDSFYQTLVAIFRNSAGPIDQNEGDTLDYFRLRRNCLLHRNGIPSSDLQIIMDQKGAAMNAYWGTQKSVLRTLDFTSHKISLFNERDMRDVFGIIRQIAKNIDDALLRALDKDAILNYVLIDFVPSHKDTIATKPRETYDRKFARMARERFLISETDAISFISRVPLHRLT